MVSASILKYHFAWGKTLFPENAVIIAKQTQTPCVIPIHYNVVVYIFAVILWERITSLISNMCHWKGNPTHFHSHSEI